MLGFPCNQFGKQEPGGADEIEQTCHVNYGVSFPMFEKVDVNGPAAHPLFRYLKQALPGVLGGRIKWNFTKFLIGRDGTPLTRFAPFTTPEKMEASIVAALTRWVFPSCHVHPAAAGCPYKVDVALTRPATACCWPIFHLPGHQPTAATRPRLHAETHRGRRGVRMLRRPDR